VDRIILIIHIRFHEKQGLSETNFRNYRNLVRNKI
jgi:hypothetical protein